MHPPPDESPVVGATGHEPLSSCAMQCLTNISTFYLFLLVYEKRQNTTNTLWGVKGGLLY